MPKQDVRMTENEIDQFLRAQHTTTVVGVTPEGPPCGAFGRFEYSGRASVIFAVRPDDPIVAILDVDGRACCVVEQFPSYYEIMGVMLHGYAERIETSDRD